MKAVSGLRASVFGPSLLAIAACGRAHHDAPVADPPPVASTPSPAVGATQPPAGAPSCTIPAVPLRYPGGHRVVVIGDLHGDLSGTKSALRAAGAIGSADDHWIGGDLTIVQTGDVLDRNDDEQAMLELLAKLADEAPKSGGAVIQLLGNHELMNAAHDFRYVTPGSRTAFGGDRAAALGPGGEWAKKLATHGTIAIIGDTVYSHAGVLPAWTSRLDEVNRSNDCWLAGQAGGADDEPAGARAEDGPVWTREYGGPADQVACGQLITALTALGAKRMVVGHTVQPSGINSACDGALWRIDVGLGREYGGPIEVLAIDDGAEPRVLRGTR